MSDILSGIELSPLLFKIITDIKGFETSLDEAATIAGTKADEISNQLNKLNRTGDKLEKLGGTLTRTLTLPIAGAAVASGNLALGFESDFAKVSTLLDDSSTDFEEYKDDVVDGSLRTGIAIGDYTDAVYQAISASIDQADAVEFTTDAMKLAKGGFTSAASSVDILTTILNAYNLKASETTNISDKLVTTQNLGKTTVDELASSMGKVIPTANAFNTNIDNVCTGMALLTKNGIDTAEATTYLNTMLNELGKSGTDADKILREKTGKSFSELMDSGMSLADVLSIVEDGAKESGKALGDMFGAEAMKAALTIMKDDGVEFNGILEDMADSAGATEESYDKIASTTGEKLKKSWNELKIAGMELGEALLPVIDGVSNGIHSVANFLNDLNPEGQKILMTTLGIAAAAGPLLSITGKGIKLFTTLKPLISGTSAGLGALGASSTVAGGAITGLGATLGTAVAAVAPFAVGIAALGVVGYETYKVFNEDVIPEIDVFADKVEGMPGVYDEMGNAMSTTTLQISDATKEAVGAYLDLDRDARSSLMNLYSTQAVITDEIKKDMTTKTNDMASQVIAGYENQKTEALQNTQDMFSELGVLTDEEQQAILEKEASYYDNKISDVKTAQETIDAIWEKASKEHREVTAEEYTQITTLQNSMQTNAIQALSEQETEANIILERMKVSNTRVTAEMVSENIKKLNEQRDNAIDAALRTYEGRKEQYDFMLNEEKSITQEQYDTLIATAKQQRDDTIKAAQDTRDGAVETMMAMNTDLEDEVDTSSGEIKTKWQSLMDKWDEWTPDVKSFEGNVTLKAAAWSGYLVQTTGHAEGGIPLKPHQAWVSEIEPEAIIPLSKTPEVIAETIERSGINLNSSNNSNQTVFNNNINIEGNADSHEIDKRMHQLLRYEAGLI